MADTEQPREPAIDAEQFRQFQQYQEFLRFQEAQRQLGAAPQGGAPQQGGAPHQDVVPYNPPTPQTPQAQPGQWPPAVPPGQWPPTPPPPPKREGPPLWLRILKLKLVRRLITLIIVLLLANWAYQHYFGTDDNGGVAHDSGGQSQTPLTPGTPKGTVEYLFQHISMADTTYACLLFQDDTARNAFAKDVGEKDCAAAVLALKRTSVGDVTHYAHPDFPDEYLKFPATGSVQISTCRLIFAPDALKPGFTPLGRFTVSSLPNKNWIITGYQHEDCAATSSTSPTSR
ncbi:hypothetical protein F0L68_06640 [Solihabitans fulvus]|uniref:Uncharacterized protein n=1 Tax=Solihabitans fulvus TaxID=1892852 RepID=A0A5B2XPE1_9PSEU|nr:hypothetical protein [Solihabitans fulvus]KAA2264761.1 hypothetical protein F0L68_06640 [Solihabitans fulvus]